MYSANTQAYEAYNCYVDDQSDPLPLVVSPYYQSWDCKIPILKSQDLEVIPGLQTLRVWQKKVALQIVNFNTNFYSTF